jgi:tetratricopeptide (TPR) repeat protein
MRFSKYWLPIMLFIMSSGNGIAQSSEGDKLRLQILESMNDTARVNKLIKLAYFYPENDSEAERSLKQAYDVSKKLGYRYGMILGQYYEVLQLTREGKYDNAIERCKQCINEMDSIHVVQYLYNFPLSDIKGIYNLAGKQVEKLQYYKDKVAYYKYNGPVENLADCYHGIAGFYHHYANHEKAIEYYMRAWDVYKKFDPFGCVNEKQNIGSEYMAWGNLNKAEEYLKSALQDQINISKGANCFFCFHQLGDLYYKRQYYKLAQHYYNLGIPSCTLPEFKAINLVSRAAIQLQLSANDSARLFLDSADRIRLKEKLGIYFSIGTLEIDYIFYKYFIAMGNETRAFHHLESALKEARNSRYIPLVLKYSYELQSYLLSNGDSIQALPYLIQYQSLQDSLIAMNTRVGIANFETDKIAQLREKEIENLQNQKKNQRALYLIGAAFLLLIVSGAFSRFNYIRKTEKEKLTTQFKNQLAHAEARALRAQMNPHFIFNCLNSINCFIIDQEHNLASEYLIKFSRLIRLIMENSGSETIPLEKELEALNLYVLLESARFANKFDCEFHIEKCLNTQRTMIPPMLLQPFIENAIWHGLMHKETAGTINIVIKKTGSRLLHISIIDDGIGREKALELNSKSGTHKSYGLEVTAHRIDMMNKLNSAGADMNIFDLKDERGNAKGTKVDLILPY